MIYKIYGEVVFDASVQDGQTPEEFVAEYLKKLPNENCQIKAAGQVTQIYESGDFEFNVSVNASVEAEDEDEAMDIVENNLEYDITNCRCTITDLDWDN